MFFILQQQTREREQERDDAAKIQAELSAAREELRCNASVIETLQAQVCMHYQSDKLYKKKRQKNVLFAASVSSYAYLCQPPLTFLFITALSYYSTVSYPLFYDSQI